VGMKGERGRLVVVVPNAFQGTARSRRPSDGFTRGSEGGARFPRGSEGGVRFRRGGGGRVRIRVKMGD